MHCICKSKALKSADHILCICCNKYSKLFILILLAPEYFATMYDLYCGPFLFLCTILLIKRYELGFEWSSICFNHLLFYLINTLFVHAICNERILKQLFCVCPKEKATQDHCSLTFTSSATSSIPFRYRDMIQNAQKLDQWPSTNFWKIIKQFHNTWGIFFLKDSYHLPSKPGFNPVDYQSATINIQFKKAVKLFNFE